MAIKQAELEVKITDTQAFLDVKRSYLRIAYEVFHRPTGATVAANEKSMIVGTAVDLIDADRRMRAELETDFSVIKWHYGPLAALNNLSPFDASLCMRNWTFINEGEGLWTVAHPLSGTFEDVALDTDGTFPGLVQRVLKVVTLVLPPPIWTWAESPEPGKLSARCVAVDGAASYNVYNDLGDGTFTLLGSAPTANGGTITVAPGTYTVQMAGVVDGVVGILGLPVQVTVEAASVPLELGVMELAREPEPEDEGPGFWEKVRQWFKKDDAEGPEEPEE